MWLRRPGDARCDTTADLGKLMLSIMGGITDYADTAVMRSWAAEMQAWPGLLTYSTAENGCGDLEGRAAPILA